jgi:hypothetical protein
VPGLRAIGVRCDNMVNLLGIAQRAGVSREAVRLWATGKRGSGGFPKPVLITSGGEQLWDWLEVAPWIDEHHVHERRHVLFWDAAALSNANAARPRIVCAADRVLAARDALMSMPDDDVRQEFERLLEDA